jgi:hypothetical protein
MSPGLFRAPATICSQVWHIRPATGDSPPTPTLPRRGGRENRGDRRAIARRVRTLANTPCLSEGACAGLRVLLAGFDVGDLVHGLLPGLGHFSFDRNRACAGGATSYFETGLFSRLAHAACRRLLGAAAPLSMRA